MTGNVQTEKDGWRCGFWNLIATQFQGAFSDSAFKNLVIFLIVGMGLSQQERDTLVPSVGILYGLPFLLFSMTGGFLADRFSKRAVTIGTKGMEISVMLLAVAGLATANIYSLFAVVFLMSTQSALFGPSKYGLLPELLPSKRLSWGNGVIELGTFLAIITGTIAGAWLSELPQEGQIWSGVILVGLAVAGLFMSLGISRVPPANPARTFRVNFVADVWSHLKESRADRVLFLAIIGNAYFWFVSALLQPLIVIYASDLLGASIRGSGLLLAAIGLGIGLGSTAAGSLSGNKIEYGLIPLGALGMTAFGAVLALPGLSFVMVAVLLALLGFSSGFFVVPVNALIQHRPAKAKKGGVIASASFLSWIGILLSSGAYYLLTVPLGLRPTTIFWVTSAVTLTGTVWAITLLPRSLLRLLLWFLTHTDLSDSDRRATQHTGEGRGIVCVQPPLLRGCGVVDGIDRAFYPLPHVQGLLRAADYQADSPSDGDDSHRFHPAATRHAAFTATGFGGHPEGRGGVYFCRGADYPDWSAYAFSAGI